MGKQAVVSHIKGLILYNFKGSTHIKNMTSRSSQPTVPFFTKKTPILSSVDEVQTPSSLTLVTEEVRVPGTSSQTKFKDIIIMNGMRSTTLIPKSLDLA